MKRRSRKVVPIADLWDQRAVWFHEALRMSGYSRPALKRLIQEDRVKTFIEGKRLRVVVSSLQRHEEGVAS